MAVNIIHTHMYICKLLFAQNIPSAFDALVGNDHCSALRASNPNNKKFDVLISAHDIERISRYFKDMPSSACSVFEISPPLLFNQSSNSENLEPNSRINSIAADGAASFFSIHHLLMVAKKISIAWLYIAASVFPRRIHVIATLKRKK